MITDPNYVLPAHLTPAYYASIDADSARMIQRELSGINGGIPTSVVDEVSAHIESCINDCPNEPGYIY